MARTGRQSSLLKKPDEHIVKDYDPEADVTVDHNSEATDSEDSDAQNAGTEHYVPVGKSKLRQKEVAALGAKYRGSRVSRDALEQSDGGSDEEGESSDEQGYDDEEHYADPDLVDLEADEAAASDSEIDSDNAFTESDHERRASLNTRANAKSGASRSHRASAADFMTSSDEDDGGANLSLDGDDDEDNSDLSDGSSDEDMDDGLDDLANGGSTGSVGSEEEGTDEDEASASRTLTNGVNKQDSTPLSADTQKGLAIQQQRKTYDGLLNLRMRLQKALVAANSFAAVSEEGSNETEPYAAAEEAAVNLLNTMSTLRDSFVPGGRAGTKRKRDMDPSAASVDLWAQMNAAESQLSKRRQELLEKWSRKTQGATSQAVDGRMSSKGGRKPLTSALRDQLNDPEGRLVKRTKVPRSCAPAQAAQRVGEDDTIYDDADFYQLLLKELVDQRTVESSAASTGQGPTVMLAAAKEAKTRREVDRKASKGRKMRFTVHEKLQNFMAPEDRRSWEPAAIDRLFGTLFGQRLAMDEDEAESDREDVEIDTSGLRLFG